MCVCVHWCERERERGRGSLIAFVGVLLVEKNYNDIIKWLSSQSDSLFVVQRSGKLQITCSDYAWEREKERDSLCEQRYPLVFWWVGWEMNNSVGPKTEREHQVQLGPRWRVKDNQVRVSDEKRRNGWFLGRTKRRIDYLVLKSGS